MQLDLKELICMISLRHTHVNRGDVDFQTKDYDANFWLLLAMPLPSTYFPRDPWKKFAPDPWQEIFGEIYFMWCYYKSGWREDTAPERITERRESGVSTELARPKEVF
jgi:hypothetical protein